MSSSCLARKCNAKINMHISCLAFVFSCLIFLLPRLCLWLFFILSCLYIEVVWSDLVWSGLALPCRDLSCFALSGLFWSGLVLSYLALLLYFLILSLSLSWLVLLYLSCFSRVVCLAHFFHSYRHFFDPIIYSRIIRRLSMVSHIGCCDCFVLYFGLV